jgi:peptidoglycan hydrolase-like protein with peptidoglycan-binding domain
MSRMFARLAFLAFIGLMGLITYNALYLQEQRTQAFMPKVIRGEQPPVAAPKTVAVTSTTPSVPALPSPPKVSAVTTDLPPLDVQSAPEQLVTAIQRELASRGYGTGGPADGKLDEATRKAIAAFEKDKGLPVTGTPTDALLRYILLGETGFDGPSTGSVTKAPDVAAPKSPAKADATVKRVQQTLANLGYAPGPVDGTMGDETERALSAFQRDRKLNQNGRITPELLKEMALVTGQGGKSGGKRP